MARSPNHTRPTGPGDPGPDPSLVAPRLAAATRKNPGSKSARSRRTLRKARKPPGLVLVRKPNRIYWIEGTYLDVRVRGSTFETDLARAKQVLSDKLKLVRDNHDSARGGCLSGPPAAAPISPSAMPAPAPREFMQPAPVPLPASSDRTFREACEGYLAAKGGSEKSDWRKQVNKIREGLDPGLACRDMGGNAFLTATIADLGDDEWTEGTIKRQIVTPIKAILTWAAQEWGANGGCFVPAYRKMAMDNVNDTVLTPEFAETVMEKAEDLGLSCLAAVIAVGLCEGPRRTELFNLVLEDVNLDTGRMVFRQVKDKPGDPNSKVKRNRIVKKAHRRTIETLEAYVGRTGRERGPVFVRDNGTVFPTAGAFGREMSRGLAAVTGWLPDHYTLHVLRHSFASYEYAVRPDPEWVRVRGDWKSLSSAMRYVHLLGEDSAMAVRAFWREIPAAPLARN